MPINAGIISNGFQPIQPPDVGGSLARILQLRGLEQRQQAHALEVEQEQRKMARQQKLEQLAQEFGGDPERFLQEYSKFDPVGAAELAKKHADGRKSSYDAYDAQLKSETAELETATRELQAIAPGDVQTFAGWRSKWTARNPELNRVIPPPDQFTPDVQGRLLTLGSSTTDFLKAKQEGLKAFLAGDYRKGLGGALAVVPSLELAQQTIAEAKKAIPVGAQGDIALFEGLLAQSGGDLNAFRQAAGSASMSEKERQDIAAKAVDDKREAEQFAETKRHNAVTEGISRGNLSVAQARLRQEGGGGGAKPGDAALVQSILKNPAIYAGLTPTTKERLIGPLTQAGFTGFSSGQTGKPPTGAQNRALNFFNRAKQASDEIDAVSGEISQLGLMGQARLKYAPNIAQTQTGQSYDAAQRAFTEARLRKDSGAAIPEHEFENDRRTYFVQPGDTPQTIAQKARQRAAVLASLAYEAGPALHGFYGDDAEGVLTGYKQAMTGADTKPPKSAPAAGHSVTAPNGKTYTFKTAGELAAFKARAGIK